MPRSSLTRMIVKVGRLKTRGGNSSHQISSKSLRSETSICCTAYPCWVRRATCDHFQYVLLPGTESSIVVEFPRQLPYEHVVPHGGFLLSNTPLECPARQYSVVPRNFTTANGGQITFSVIRGCGGSPTESLYAFSRSSSSSWNRLSSATRGWRVLDRKSVV